MHDSTTTSGERSGATVVRRCGRTAGSKIKRATSGRCAHFSPASLASYAPFLFPHQGKVAVIQHMNHDGEVNRARYCPHVRYWGGGTGGRGGAIRRASFRACGPSFRILCCLLLPTLGSPPRNALLLHSYASPLPVTESLLDRHQDHQRRCVRV